jgi:hypothetical protein
MQRPGPRATVPGEPALDDRHTTQEDAMLCSTMIVLTLAAGAPLVRQETAPSATHAPDASDDQPAGWTTSVVLDAGEKLGGLAIGDADPNRVGTEIVVVSASGAVRVLSRKGDAWSAEIVFQAPGEMVQVAIGDVVSPTPGPAIAAVGMLKGGEDDGGTGAAWLVQRVGTEWRATRLMRSKALLHGVCIHEGNVFAAGYDGRLWRLTFRDGEWRHDELFELPGAGKALLSTPRGVVIACTDGSLVLARRDGDAYEAEVLDRRSAGRARIGRAGEQLVVADDDGVLSIVEGGARSELHRAADKLRGAVLADLVPAWPGLEAATAGYDRTVTVLRETDGAWTGEVVLRDDERFHHLAAGDLGTRPGLDLAACGYSGRVYVIERLP